MIFTEGQIGVVSHEGKTICYGETAVYHSAVGAGGARIRKGTRLVAIKFGTSTEVPIEGDLSDLIVADIAKHRRKGSA